MTAIRVKGLTHRFGGVEAVKDVTFEVEEGSILSIIGPNGAGKTTLFNVLTGLYPIQSGSIEIEELPSQRPLTWQTVLGWAAVAVIVALIGLVVTVGLEGTFRVFSRAYPDGFGAACAAAIERVGRYAGLAVSGAAVTGGLAFAACAVLWQRARATPDVVVVRGVARTFQNLRLFPSMTVREHLRLVYEWSPRRPRDVAGAVEKLIAEMGLDDVAEQQATALPYARQRRVEIARALATSPRILLLDEPAAGMTPAEVHDLIDLLRGLKRKGLTIVLIEHRMKVVMGLSDHVVVLDHGAKIAEGTPREVAADPAVIEAYLGSEAV